LSGFQVCKHASKGCAAACLNTAGRGQFNSVQTARINKTRRLFLERDAFLADLVKDLVAVSRKAKKLGKIPVVRLNGTSDLDWSLIKVDGVNMFEMFPSIQFYDYTKDFSKLIKNSYSNYNLTFSQSETNQTEVKTALSLGFNVAVVFDYIPEAYLGHKTVDGTLHDLRFLDPKSSVVGLVAKGKAKKDASGFVVQTQSVQGKVAT
jgi:hypothetical protein